MDPDICVFVVCVHLCSFVFICVWRTQVEPDLSHRKINVQFYVNGYLTTLFKKRYMMLFATYTIVMKCRQMNT